MKSDIMMKKINNLEKLDISNDDNEINTKEKKLIFQPETDEFNIKQTGTFTSYLSDTSTVKSDRSAKTYQSKPFNKELDFDIPDFTPTKYGPGLWKISHCTSYFIFAITFIVSNISLIVSKNYDTYNIILLVSHAFYCISSSLEWWYFKRGCIGYANLNSRVKDNIDKSFKARILRSEQGWKYFFSFCAAIILVYGNCYYIMYINGKKSIPDPEYWNINLIGAMVISLAQILKLEKILMETKQYVIKNDLSNCLIEIFLFFASLAFGTIYFYRLLYNYDNQNFTTFYIALRISGSIMIFFSSFFLINRYYMHDYEDLNASDLSNVTL
jgi:hypothetical protein